MFPGKISQWCLLWNRRKISHLWTSNGIRIWHTYGRYSLPSLPISMLVFLHDAATFFYYADQKENKACIRTVFGPWLANRDRIRCTLYQVINKKYCAFSRKKSLELKCSLKYDFNFSPVKVRACGPGLCETVHIYSIPIILSGKPLFQNQ